MTSQKVSLTQVQRENIVKLSAEGLSQVKIAERMNCSRKGVQYTLKRFLETGSCENKPKTGRKRKTTPRADRQIVRTALANRRLTSAKICNMFNTRENVNISSVTVRRRLLEAGLKGCKARKKPLLTEKHRKSRLEFARKYKHWEAKDWENVLWSDECNIELFGTPGAIFVRRRPKEEFSPECIAPTVKYGGGSVMIWGCMAASGTGELFICEGRMNSATYCDMLSEVLEPSFLKLFRHDSQDTIWFQQDNAPCHRSAASTAWMRENEIKVLDWPAQSPDLNPIEHLWPKLKANVAKHNCKSKPELIRTIKEEWEKIAVNFCNTLVSSMPRRVAAVIRAKGGSTRY